MTFAPFENLKALRESEGLSSAESSFDDSNFKALNKEALNKLHQGVELSLDEVDLSDYNLKYQDEMVLIYSREQRQNSEHDYTFHFLNCQFLKDKLGKEKDKTHVCTNRQDGVFLVNVVDNSHNIIEKNKQVKLKTCNRCLSANGGYEGFDFYKHDWKNQPASKDWRLRNDFAFKHFFSTYRQKITKTKHQVEISSPYEYAPQQKTYKHFLKNIRQYVCETCHFDFSDKEFFLTLHHEDNDPTNNDLDNLKLLCFCCHTDEEGSGHARLKKNQKYLECKEYRGF